MYKFSYNTSIVSLEEAKGTLLASKGITVAEPAPREPRVGPKDEGIAPAAFEGPTLAPAFAPAPAKDQPAATSYKLKARIAGIPLLEVEVEMNPNPPTKAVPPTR